MSAREGRLGCRARFASVARWTEKLLEVVAQGVIHNFHGMVNAEVGKARHPVSGDAARYDATVVR